MNGKALGLIETFGLVPAVEAADVAVKSANVEIEGCRCVGAGLVTVMMTGDVSSVKASVDAGKSAAERLGRVRSVTVIARTGEGLEQILAETGGAKPEPLPEREAPLSIVRETAEVAAEPPAEGADVATGTAPSEAKENPDEAEEVARPTWSPTALKKMKVSKLRNLARQTGALSLGRDEIKSVGKKDLIEAIVQYYRQEEE